MMDLDIFDGSHVDFSMQNVIDEMLEGFQVISPEWRYLYVNNTVAEQGKKTKEELIGHTMMECYPGIETTEMFMQLKSCMTEQKSIRFENEFIYTDGTKGWFFICVHPVEKGLLIFSIDITDRKNTEIELKEKIREVDILMNSTIDRETQLAELKKEIEKLKMLANRG